MTLGFLRPKPQLREIEKVSSSSLANNRLPISVVGTYREATARNFINGYAQADIAKQQLDGQDGVEQLLVEELPGSKPHAKERLVLASIATDDDYKWGTGPFVLANNWFKAHCSISPTAFVYVASPRSYFINNDWEHLSMFSGFLEKVPGGAARTLIVTRERRMPMRSGWMGQTVGHVDYQGLSGQYGDLITEGAEHMHLNGGTTESDVIRYVGGRNVQHEEELIGGKPLVSTKAGNLFKETVETLMADAFSSRRN
ncbi:hypothetical protein FA15DRAFT_665342 [Coprinopsis marcescibilis]|uniref:Uncharacterized protein n=1 Tax=Coprinopsis marcescibilis TaxID=230819 RepID=A0A5C3L6V3_COPMA|nr:hypothetical protein FA15DRAFT_665342 [Coprinopsis marcescibilis]